MKNTHMKQKTFNKKNKILDNDFDNPFDKEIENELLKDYGTNDNQYNDDDDDIIEDDVSDEYDEDVSEEEDEVPVKIVENIEENKPKKRGRKSSDKTKFYVEPKMFDEEIIKFYDSGVISNELAEMISKISHKLSYAPNFINYSYREEMVGDGIIRMMKAIIAKKYNRDKGTNPFSYFTRIAFNAFRNRIKKEKHIHETHAKYQKELMFMSENFNNVSKNNNISIMKERDRNY